MDLATTETVVAESSRCQPCGGRIWKARAATRSAKQREESLADVEGHNGDSVEKHVGGIGADLVEKARWWHWRDPMERG
ncbi:Os11g0707250 [Oryza sativa Japonica Group]|uniref:Os11g0707250 protein n=1 Tax=Oryza sativa subsp. japonica TaxID=39947 RepID=A0A0P0Y5P5_ORYSJ|nr:Os11g0707250 [Oryza sativa Japonica Group]